MKLTSFALSITALHAVAAAAAADCNVEGSLFNLQAFKTINGTRRTGGVQVKQTGDLGTEVLAHFSSYPDTQTAVFYINTENNRLIVLDPFSFLKASNGYTDDALPAAGELKFTFYNDTSRPEPYNWPVFGIDEESRYLTVDGEIEGFGYCPEDEGSPLLTGSIVVGENAINAEGCEALDGLMVYPVTSELAIE
ncbi:uncharacterized protein BDV14DRAFT_196253 [Aspergillus stella-maris]|uniref:uncharacterized protein n=1 Tax=Aspergillus stella-maris TaxID=1810926 RepID=UPI003CCE4B65